MLLDFPKSFWGFGTAHHGPETALCAAVENVLDYQLMSGH